MLRSGLQLQARAYAINLRSMKRSRLVASTGLGSALRPREAPSAVNAERVYALERELTKFGFTPQQARTLVLTASGLRKIRQKVDYSVISQIFHAAWQAEDNMLQAGFPQKAARNFGLMFVALAGCKEDRKLSTDEYWNFWEISTAQEVSDCLESASAKKRYGYDLARSMLLFAMQEWKS